MHRALLAAAVFLAVAFAGCADSSGGGDSGSGSGATGSGSLTSSGTGAPTKPVAYSDTLHLLAAPAMALALPAGGSEVETGTAGNFGPGGGNRDGPPSQWSYNVTGYSNVTAASVHVWIDVKEQLVQPPGFPPTNPPCTWYIRLALGADGSPETKCLSEAAGPIATGVKELVFDLPGLATQLETNETVSFLFGRSVFSTSQGDAVAVLSGTEAHDSRIILTGLKEALPAK